MNTLFVGVLAILFALFAPEYIENAPSECGAVAIKVLSYEPNANLDSPLARGLINTFAGPFIQAMISAQSPNVPAPVACSYLYWRMTFDPSVKDQLRESLRPRS